VKLSKADRETVRMKFGGKCAYCGCDLPERWHADHFEPVVRELKFRQRNDGTHRLESGKPSRPEFDTIDNHMPACPRCNISKSSLTIEQWRGWIVGHVKALSAHHTPYNIAKAYGLIVETGAPVKFYFEKFENAAAERKEGE